MTTPSRDPQTQPEPAPLKRRGLLLGVGAAGAAVLAAKTMPGAVAPLAAAASTAVKAVDPHKRGLALRLLDLLREPLECL